MWCWRNQRRVDGMQTKHYKSWNFYFYFISGCVKEKPQFSIKFNEKIKSLEKSSDWQWINHWFVKLQLHIIKQLEWIVCSIFHPFSCIFSSWFVIFLHRKKNARQISTFLRASQSPITQKFRTLKNNYEIDGRKKVDPEIREETKTRSEILQLSFDFLRDSTFVWAQIIIKFQHWRKHTQHTQQTMKFVRNCIHFSFAFRDGAVLVFCNFWIFLLFHSSYNYILSSHTISPLHTLETMIVLHRRDQDRHQQRHRRLFSHLPNLILNIRL